MPSQGFNIARNRGILPRYWGCKNFTTRRQSVEKSQLLNLRFLRYVFYPCEHGVAVGFCGPVNGNKKLYELKICCCFQDYVVYVPTQQFIATYFAKSSGARFPEPVCWVVWKCAPGSDVFRQRICPVEVKLHNAKVKQVIKSFV